MLIQSSPKSQLITQQAIIILLCSFWDVFSFHTTSFNVLSKKQIQQTRSSYLISNNRKRHLQQQQSYLFQNEFIRFNQKKKNILILYDNNGISDESISEQTDITSTTFSVNNQQDLPVKNDDNNNKERLILSRQDFIRESLAKKIQVEDESNNDVSNRRNLIINTITIGLIGILGISTAYLFQSTVYTPPGFQRIYPTQYIAALGNPNANSGTNSNEWGLWNVDPGPRGIYLRDYDKELVSNNYENPVYNWKFDTNDWWVEEHGIIMESPKFPLPSGRYLVTGGRLITTGITINTDGTWKFDDDTTTLYDVTHLPCRSARYKPSTTNNCSPNNANLRNFPVSPGREMPNINDCTKQDYAVLFLIGKAI
jgi:hypothetical protein